MKLVVLLAGMESNHHNPCDDQIAQDQEDRDLGTVRILLLRDREEVHSILYLVVEALGILEVVVMVAEHEGREENEIVDVRLVEVCDIRLDEVERVSMEVVDRYGSRDHLSLFGGDIAVVVRFLVLLVEEVRERRSVGSQLRSLVEVRYFCTPHD